MKLGPDKTPRYSNFTAQHFFRLAALKHCSNSHLVKPKPLFLASVITTLVMVGCSTDQRVADSSAVTDEQTVAAQAEVALIDKATSNDEVVEEHKAQAEYSSPQKLQEVIVTAAKNGADTRSLQGVKMKRAASAAEMHGYQLMEPPMAAIHSPQLMVQDRENYLPQKDNPIHQVREAPVSTFSVDVDTASYSNVRRMIMKEGRLPPRDAVKAEEFINYFAYDYPKPESTEQPFSVHTEVSNAPWNKQRKLIKIGLRGYEPESRPAANLVFLIDVSGSMQSEDKLGLAKRSLKMLTSQMRDDDRIALVVYAGAAGLVLPSTPGTEKSKINTAIDQLTAGGSTHGSAGIKLAYQVASQNFIENGINRVLIASDGDMNVGTVNLNALKDLVAERRESGIALSTLGFGSGNYNYALMEQLADVGNGNAAYLDSLKEAHRVLVQQMNSTLLTIAKDVKVQVEFNPERVSEYRLIGYENRMLKREDFSNDKIDAGDIGAGHRVTALYEVTLKGSGAEAIAPLRYSSEGKASASRKTSEELAYVKLRYKLPNEDHSRLVDLPILQSETSDTSTDMKFASAVAGFAQLLRGGEYTGEWSYEELLSLARAGRGQDNHGDRAELVKLIELSQQWKLAQF